MGFNAHTHIDMKRGGCERLSMLRAGPFSREKPDTSSSRALLCARWTRSDFMCFVVSRTAFFSSLDLLRLH